MSEPHVAIFSAICILLRRFSTAITSAIALFHAAPKRRLRHRRHRHYVLFTICYHATLCYHNITPEMFMRPLVSATLEPQRAIGHFDATARQSLLRFCLRGASASLIYFHYAARHDTRFFFTLIYTSAMA